MRQLNATLGVLGALLLTAACGSGDSTVRDDYGFDGSTTVPFSLTVRTYPNDVARAGYRLDMANDKKTINLGAANCINEQNGDEAYPITIKGHIKNPVGDLSVKVNLSVEDPTGKALDADSSRTVAVAWLYKDKADCLTTRDGTMSVTLKGAAKGSDAQVQGYLILPGGVNNYDGYQLNVTTNAGKVYNLKGHVLPYKDTGVTAKLTP